MKKTIQVIVLMYYCLFHVHCLFAEDCPDISTSLQVALDKTFPEYELALYERFFPQEQKSISKRTNRRCLHITAIAESVYAILLKNKKSGAYLIVQAGLQSDSAPKSWHVQTVDIFTDDIPVINTTKAGFYSDMLAKKNFTVTRQSHAISAIMLNSGHHYVYKSTGTNGFDKFRIN